MEIQPTAVAPSPPSPDRRLPIALAFQLLIVLLVAAALFALYWVGALPQRVDDQQTVVLGTTRLVPGSGAALRVIVQDFAAGRPLAGADVSVSLRPVQGQPIPLFQGQTDDTGSLPVQFRVPAGTPPTATLVVETRSEAGFDRIEQPVTIERDYRLLLSTDKPLYQPGQTIHMRALALSTLDMAAASGVTVTFRVEDPKGNKLSRQTVTASDYGIAAADFQLAAVVNQGNYKLVAAIGETTSEKTVEVRPYVLPRFAVHISTDRSYYLPGQRVEGVVQADYFYGKPVAGGQVQITGSVWDVERTAVADFRGQTNANGAFSFRLDLPSYFAASGLESGQADFALEVTVVDGTGHAEQTSLVLPIAEDPLVLSAAAESGALKPGVENIVYLLTSYPDGRPAPTHLSIRVDGGLATELDTGDLGLAQLSLTPTGTAAHTLAITARDAAGLATSREVTFDAEQGADHVLLRADRAAYVVGETMHLVALTPIQAGSVYLDIVKAGQTLSTRSARVSGGRAEFTVDVSPDLYGTVELHAYKVLLDGSIVRDTRLVVVDAPNEVAIAIATDKDTYLPGETANVAFQTSDLQGTGVQTALGLAIVDESVFALEQQDPGFAKLYFMLQQELLEPFYQIKEFEFPAVIPPDEVALRDTQDRAAQAVWAGVETTGAVPLNSRQLKLDAVAALQAAGFTRLGEIGTLAAVVVPVILWVIVVVFLVRRRDFGSAFVRLLIATAMLGVLAVPITCTLLLNWGRSFEDVQGFFFVFLFVFAAGGVALAVYGWAKQNIPAQFVALLTLAWCAVLLILDRALGESIEPAYELIGFVVLGTLMVPGVYVLLGQGLWVQHEHAAGATATGMGVVAMLLLLLLPFILSSCGPAPTGQGLFGPPAAVRETVPMSTGEDIAAPAPGEPPRLRQYFPETLYWAPEVRTDTGGFVALDVPLADSITTWRLTALASSQDGRLGFTTHGIRVFQDFFVDIDLPVALTEGDEIGIPVGVFNYLPQEQEVRLVVREESWFELLGPGEQTITIASNDVAVVYFPIRVREFGRQGFQVTAWGEQMSDAIRREVAVVPDGKELWQTESNWLRESRQVPVTIPPGAIAGASYVEVKIYPGALAQVIEGLEKILQLPHG